MRVRSSLRVSTREFRPAVSRARRPRTYFVGTGCTCGRSSRIAYLYGIAHVIYHGRVHEDVYVYQYSDKGIKAAGICLRVDILAWSYTTFLPMLATRYSTSEPAKLCVQVPLWYNLWSRLSTQTPARRKSAVCVHERLTIVFAELHTKIAGCTRLHRCKPQWGSFEIHSGI